MKIQDLSVDEGGGDQGVKVNRSGFYSADPTGHFGHIVAKVLNVLSRFVCEPHFLQGLYKR